MRVDCNWNGRQNFIANVNGFKIHMDAARPFGDEKDPTPKQLVLASLCGCTGMDIVGWLKKNKQTMQKFEVNAEAEIAKTHPHEFQNIKLNYVVEGNCDPQVLAEAVKLSQTQYCAVSSILSRGTTIAYDVALNGKSILHGESDFKNS